MIRESATGATLTVRVAPGASRERIVGVHGESLKVAVRAPPEKGRANDAVARLLAAACGARARDVAVVRGATSRTKTVRFAGWTAARLRARIEAILVDLGPP